MKLVDDKKIGFTTAVELSYINKKNQNYIAVSIDSQQASPTQAQAKRMRELDEKKLLNGDVIDGIMMEDKKEVDKVILTGAELGKYFGAEATPREMKDQIIKLLDDWKGQQKEQVKPRKRLTRRNSGASGQCDPRLRPWGAAPHPEARRIYNSPSPFVG